MLVETDRRIALETMPTIHEEEIGPNHGLALRFRLEAQGRSDIVLGFTSDTDYSRGLDEFFCDCDVLVAHVKATTLPELYGAPDAKGRIGRIPTHLGFQGCRRLLTGITKRPDHRLRLAVISEWQQQIADDDVRLALVDALQQSARSASGNSTFRCLAADIGLTISLSAPPKILCRDTDDYEVYEGVRQVLGCGPEIGLITLSQ